MELVAELTMVLHNVSLPAHNQHTHTVIFLHGHESSARELSHRLWESQNQQGKSLQIIFPSVKWIFPQAEEVYVERSQGYSHRWFDIWNVRDPDERRDLQIPGLLNSAEQLATLIYSEAGRVGLRNIIIAGISQGCATAIHALLNCHEFRDVEEGNRLCAFIGMSGWMSLGVGSVQESRELLKSPYGPSENVYRNTPAFVTHFTNDPVVPLAQGKRLRDTLTAYGMEVTWKEYPIAGSWINTPQGVEDLVAFLRAQGVPVHEG